MNSKLLFVENNMIGEQHLQINMAIIDVFRKIFYTSSSSLIAANSLHEGLRKAGCEIDIELNIDVIRHGARVKRFLSDFFSWCYFSPSLSRLENQDAAVFLSLFPTSHLMLRIMSWFLSCKIYVVLHGELKMLSHFSFLPSKPSFWMRMAFFVPVRKDKIKYIVLGEHIDVPDIVDNGMVVKINHPAFFDSACRSVKKFSADNLNVGLIGTASKLKNTHLFFEVARMFKSRREYNFIVSGLCDSSVAEYRFDGVDADFSGDFVDDAVAVSKLREFDVALFFYGEEMSSFASGALIDAIRFRIPVLALRNSYFEWLKSNGVEFFLLFDSIEDMSIFLSGRDNIASLREKFNFTNASDFFSVNAAVEILRKDLCSHANYY